VGLLSVGAGWEAVTVKAGWALSRVGSVLTAAVAEGCPPLGVRSISTWSVPHDDIHNTAKMIKRFLSFIYKSSSAAAGQRILLERIRTRIVLCAAFSWTISHSTKFPNVHSLFINIILFTSP
jgi:hypothetical protein